MSESTESSEPPGPQTPGAFLRSLIAATRPPLLQKAVARRLGVSPGTVSDWLRDRHVPRWDHLDLLERLLIDHGVNLQRGVLTEKFREHLRDDEPGTGATAVYPHAPTPLTPLLGREHEVEQLMSLWERHRLVCITGPAGVGKTRLAAAVADRINEKEPGEVIWLRVDAVGDIDDLYQLIAIAVHARTSADTSVLSSIGRAIGVQPRTIVLDDLDKLDDTDDGAIVRLLERCAQLRVVATARRGMHATGAARFRVQPLAVPGDKIDLDEAREYPAIRLFTALATQAGTGDAVQRASVTQLNEICRALGGLPLCLELAAAQLDTITLHELHLQLTAKGQGGSPPRPPAAEGDAVLDTALGSSWNMLSSLAQHALACSSVFNGSFDTNRAARVIALSPGAMTSALHELVRLSMLQVDHSKLQSTYCILGPLRRFAELRLDELGDGEEVRTRHAQHVAEILAGQFPLSHTDAVERIGWSDLLTALQWSFENDTALSLRIAGNLWPHWLRVGAFATGRGWLTRVIDTCEGDVAGLARAVVGAGVLAQREGDAGRAESLLRDALELARREADAPAQHVALVNLGWLALTHGRGDEAVQYAEDVLDRASQAEHRWGAAAARSLRGTVGMLRDDPGAVDDLEQSLAISASIGDVSGAISANLQLSRLALGQGDTQRALRCATAGLADAERIGDRSMTGAALVGVGLAAKAERRWEEAASLLERAAQLMEGSEEPMARCRTLLELALARAQTGGAGATDRAIADIIAATDIAVDANARVLLPLCFERMSEVIAAPADARWLQQAASYMRLHIGLAEGGPTTSVATEAMLTDAPDTAVLAKFGEILRSITDEPGDLNPSTG